MHILAGANLCQDNFLKCDHMKNTFAIRFYCRPAKVKKTTGQAPVEVSLIVRGDRQIWQLPKYCEPEKFKKLKANSDIKIYCHNVENKLNEIYTSLTLSNDPISAFIIKDIYMNGASRYSYTLDKMFKDGLDFKLAEDVDPKLYRKYELSKDRFLELTEIDKNREAGSVKHSDILLFKSKLDKKFKPNSVEKEMQRTKFFFLLAFNNGKIKTNPFANITIKKPKSDNVFLTQDEINIIRNLKITNDRYDRIRSTFLFMCYTGLEYADMEQLKPEDVKERDNGQLYIKKKRVKTGIEYTSILYEDAIYLWKLYDGKLPLCSNQKFNLYLKKIQEWSKIDKNITTLTARHSYATYLLNERKLPLDIVSSMLGHTNTTQTKTYAKMLDTTIFDKAAEPNPSQPTNEQVYIPDQELREFQEMLGI